MDFGILIPQARLNVRPFFRFGTPVPIRSHTQNFIAMKYDKKLHKLIKKIALV